MEKILCKDCFMKTLDKEDVDSVNSGEAVITMSEDERKCECCGKVDKFALGLSIDFGVDGLDWESEGESCGGFDDFDDFNEEDYNTGDLNFDDLEFADTEDLSLNAEDLDFGDEDLSSDGDDNK